FKEYNPLKRRFTRVQRANSTFSPPPTPPPVPLTPSPPARTPEASKPPSLPTSAARQASNALLALRGYVSNTFQQFTASVSPSLPTFFGPHHDESLSTQTSPTPNHRATITTLPVTAAIQETMPEEAASENDNPHDEGD